MRIAIVGNSGSGKTTLARELERRLSLSRLDLDSVAWEPGKVAVARNQDDAIADVERFCSTRAEWVVEGCYSALVASALRFRPTLVYLDPGVEACLAHCQGRPWEQSKYESKSEQDKRLQFLLMWVRQYYVRDDDLSLSAHEALYSEYRGRKIKLTENVLPNLKIILERLTI